MLNRNGDNRERREQRVWKVTNLPLERRNDPSGGVFSGQPCGKENGGVTKIFSARFSVPLISIRNLQNIQKTKRDVCGVTRCSFSSENTKQAAVVPKFRRNHLFLFSSRTVQIKSQRTEKGLCCFFNEKNKLEKIGKARGLMH